MKESPITPSHLRHGARMGEEEGWNMPRQFSSLIEEHLATRASCGIFDISHIAKISVRGHGSLPWLESMLSNTLVSCEDGQGQRSLMLSDRGSIIDKLVVYREAAERYFILGSACMATEDMTWLSKHRPDGPIELRNETTMWSGMAVHGPESEKVFSRVFRGLDMPMPMTMERVVYRNEELLFSRSDLAGGESFEFFCPAASGIRWYEELLAAGAVPCGSNTRDCIRLEHGSTAVGRDIGMDKTPMQAGLGRFCQLNKSYPGVETLRRQQRCGSSRNLTAVACTEAGESPQAGDKVLDESGDMLGQVTSACISPASGHAIALAYLATPSALAGRHVRILTQGCPCPAVILERALI